MKYSVTIFLAVLFVVPAHGFEAVLSWEKSGWTKKTIYVSFLDENTQAVKARLEAGVTSNLYRPSAFADGAEEFLYLMMPGAGRKPWSLVVYSIESAQQVARLPLNRPNHADPAFLTHHAFESANGDRMFLLGPGKKKNWKLDVYSKPGHKLLGTTELPRGVSGGMQLPGGHVAVLTSGELGKDDRLLVLDPVEHEVVAEHLFEKNTRLQLVPSDQADQFLLLAATRTPVDRRSDLELIYADAVSLYRFHPRSGEQIDRVKLGYQPTLVYADDRNNYGYFATRRTRKSTGLTLWKIREGVAETIVESDLLYDPTAAFVDESNGTAVVLCDRRAVIFDLASGAVSYDIKLPFGAVSGFLNKDGTHLYFREGTGSEVGLLEVNRGEIVGDSPTGSSGKKFAQAVLTVAAVAAGAYAGYIPLNIPVATETSMMTDDEENSLYVINSRTSDVTFIDTETFEKRLIEPVQLPFGFWRSEVTPYLFVLGAGELMLIDPRNNKVFMQYEPGTFAGINEYTRRAYFADESGLMTIDIVSGGVINLVPELSSAYLVISSGSKIETIQ